MLSLHGFLEGTEEMMEGSTSLKAMRAPLPMLLKEGNGRREGRLHFRGAAFLNARRANGS